MKKHSLIFLLIALICITSCSQVFEAGVSGTVYTKVGTAEQGAAGVYVYSYTDKSTYEKDLTRFKNGATSPSDGNYIPRNVTNANGEFTINKIVWETKNSMFGKTADVVNLYLIFYHEDYEVCGYGPVSVISGSTNAGSVKQKLTQVRFPMPVFSGKISGGNVSNPEDYDNVKLILTNADFETYEGRGASVFTQSVEHGTDNITYTHGNYSGLGSDIKWEYPDGESSIVVNIVWDANKNGLADSGEYYHEVVVSRTTTGTDPIINFENKITL